MTSNIELTMNQLARQANPYLQQHAENPVDWQPWGEQAFALARALDKPVLLSIGYSACHWCQVMAAESFANASIAALMNEYFVCVKVDRETRPDLDRIYQTAHLFLTRNSGGWPLTMFLTADRTPFFGGTYFPPQQRDGLPGFVDILERVRDYYLHHRQEIGAQNEALKEAMVRSEQSVKSAPGEVDQTPLLQVKGLLREQFDARYGGFGTAPKFPQVPTLELALRLAGNSKHQHSTGEDISPLRIALQTLDGMVAGGIYDQVGGGFFRYSVDAQWQIPHFEKMAADNGLLLALLCQANIASGSGRYRRVIDQTAAWVMDRMQDSNGGYFTSLAADAHVNGQPASDLVEGGYYLWSSEEIDTALTTEQAQIIKLYFGMDGNPNCHGRWHPNAVRPVEEIATETGLSVKRVVVVLSGGLQTLAAERQKRTAPLQDRKILTAWNGLLIRGMADASRETGNQTYLRSAEKALEWLREQHWQDGSLQASSYQGVVTEDGFLDDYVMLMDGILALLQCRWSDDDFALLLQLANRVMELFTTAEEDGLRFTCAQREQLLVRLRPFSDDALPAGNAIAARVFGWLARLTGDRRFGELRDQIFAGSWQQVNEMPLAHAGLLAALQDDLDPPPLVVLCGQPGQFAPWNTVIRDHLGVRGYCLWVDDQMAKLPDQLAACAFPDGQAVVAYLCRDSGVSAAISDPQQLATLLQIEQTDLV